LQQKLQASNSGSKIIYKVADVGDYDAVDAAVASAVEELGRIDILINNVSYILGHWGEENARLTSSTGWTCT
jgi:NAD(P)-dependent dehydrogenase (short-subunit alcohol dehydrogenase family)